MNGTPRVRWGVLGCARVFERRMVPAFREASNAELVAVASRDQSKASAMAERHGIERAYGGYEALLADPSIDAVYIPLPNDLHVEWTLAALAAGKNVLCDKPLSLDAAGASRCARAAKDSGLRLMEGFMVRHHPQHARVREWIASGAIGEPVRFSAVFTYPATADHAGIRWNPAQGGGSFLDVGVYPVDAARWVFGSAPQAVTVVGTMDPGTGVDIHADGILEFSGGRTATFSCGFDQVFCSRYEVVGRDGVITAERAFQVGESGVRLRIRAHGSDDETVEEFPHVNQWALEVAHFGECVLDSGKPLEPGEDGAEQARVVDAVRRSMASGCRVTVD